MQRLRSELQWPGADVRTKRRGIEQVKDYFRESRFGGVVCYVRVEIRETAGSMMRDVVRYAIDGFQSYHASEHPTLKLSGFGPR